MLSGSTLTLLSGGANTIDNQPPVAAASAPDNDTQRRQSPSILYTQEYQFLRRVLDTNSALRERMGQRARETVQERFLLTRLLEQYLDLLNAFETNFRLRR